MINDKKVSKILYGGDYNPEQWDEKTIEEDMRLLKVANIDVLTMNVFNWAILQKSEEEYDFSKLDKIMKKVKDNGFKVCMATSTGAHPAWMAKKYPDILRVEFDGKKRKFGGRHNSCPNSPTFRKYSKALAKRLAERYKGFDNIIAWHISNEYGGACYCENCEKEFRVWLKRKYKTIEKVNEVWDTNFWGHTFYDFDEIVVPNLLSEHFEFERTMFQGISLDYARFNSDSMLENYKDEYDEIKKITPDIKITTNLMGFYKPLDYQKWSKYMDFISWDNYPSPEDPYTKTSMNHALMRGLKKGEPFALMEQTPSVTNWQPYNALKRPGVMRLLSYQAVAQGSDTVMFFQMRRSIGACEKFHGAVIDHVGSENTRVFRECMELGTELNLLEDSVIGSRVNSKIAILFDWDNWWALEYSAGPSKDLKYIDQVFKYYDVLSKLNMEVDFISYEDNFEDYKILIAPSMYMVKQNTSEKIESFTKNGGVFITTFFSGIVDENDLVVTGGYPGKLRNLLGIWVEESDALLPNAYNEIRINNEYESIKGVYKSNILCDIIHLEGAEVVGTYLKDFYKDTPAVTKNNFGEGEAWYIGTNLDKEGIKKILVSLCDRQKIEAIMKPVEGIEVTRRIKNKDGFVFVLNHNNESASITIGQSCRELITGRDFTEDDVIELNPKDIFILKVKI